MSEIATARPSRWRPWLAGRRAAFKRQTPFPTGPAGRRGWAVATATLVVAAGAIATSAVGCDPGVRTVVVEIGIVGWVLLAVAVFWRPAALTPSLLVLALPALFVVGTHSDQQAIVIGIAPLLVATGELAGWSFDLRSVVSETAAVTRRRLLDITIVTVGAAAVAGAVLAVSTLPAPGGILPLLAGAGATLAVVALATVRRW
jgi:hypothetical protein